MDVIGDLRSGPLLGDDDMETAIALARLVHAELEDSGRLLRCSGSPANRSPSRSGRCGPA